MKNDMEVGALINLGSLICTRIKNLSYPGQPWDMTLSKEIAKKLTLMKQKARIYHPEVREDKLLEILNFRYNNEDLLELLGR